MLRVENRLLRNRKSKASRRGVIKRFSRGSQRRLARILLNNAEKFKYFFTVTYRVNQRDCRISKVHIDRFLTRFRKACGSKVGYVWVLEFQKRGAVHFHVWFEKFLPHSFPEWERISVRKQIVNRFKDDEEELGRFKFLTYLWLKVSGQLEDEKAVKAATDLKVITSSNFTVGYAIKYAWKVEQKDPPALIDYETGEVFSEWWVGRFWGASGKIRNEKVYYTTNTVAVRVLRKWLERYFGKKEFGGLWIMWKPELRERLVNVSKELDIAGVPREDEWRG